VLRLVIVQGLALAGAGVAIGLVASMALAPVLASQLFGVRFADLPTMLGVPALLLAVAAVACYVPARRAMAVDPVEALRT
jgi:ABC-type antimicrobial peptide transport system permease subunit